MPETRRELVMNNIQKISETEPHEAVRRGAMSIADFCRRYGIGRTTAYEQIKAGQLRARKCGKRTIISDADAEDFLHQLPILAAMPVQHRS
jgi:excisionase family DNA binding protein